MGPIASLEADLICDIVSGNVPIMWGKAGCGKTEMTKGIARKLGRMMVTIIPALCDPTDINGFPIPNREHRVSGHGNKNYPVIEFAPRRNFLEMNAYPGGGLLYCDEITGGSASSQSALLTTMTDRRAGDFQFHNDVGIIASANPPDEAVNGHELGGPMVNRLNHYHFPLYVGDAPEASSSASNGKSINPLIVNEWADNVVGYWGDLNNFWFTSRDIPYLNCTVETSHMVRGLQYISEFLRKRPQLWHVPNEICTSGWPSARSWVRAARSLALAFAMGKGVESAVNRIAAAVGLAAALEFLSYAKTADLPDPEAVLADPTGWKFSGRPDIDYAVLIAVVAAVQAKPTAKRVLAAFEVAGRSTDRSGGPVKEAAMVAIRPLSVLIKVGTPSYRLITEKMDRTEAAEFNNEIHKITKKFSAIANLIAS